MSSAARFLAADLGASSGRLMLCSWDGERFALEELHRFANGGVAVHGELCWNALGLWKGILDGMSKFHSRFSETPSGIGVDAWGVDFALLDGQGRLVANPVHYRDARTRGAMPKVFARVAEEQWFASTGTQSQEINTLFQISSMVLSHDPRLELAKKLVMIPDLFLHFLCGEGGAEFTDATTTQMYCSQTSSWAEPLLERAGVPTRLLPHVVAPATVLAQLRPPVIESCGFPHSFPAIAVASHDTASAVAAIPEMDDRSAFICSGTWSLMGVQIAAPNTSDKARRLGFTNEGSADGRILLLKNLTGLWILQECLRAWSRDGEEMAWEALLQAASAARAFTWYIDPNHPRLQAAPNMPGAIQSCCRETGQSVPEGLGEIASCVLQSLALKYRSTLEQLSLLTGRALETIRIVGGGSLNRLLCQMTADATGCIVVAGPVEASALGNGMLQAMAAGRLSGIENGRAAIAASVVRQVYEPARNSRWEEAFAFFKKIELN